jgi:SAM-dependent methyltransferase
MTVRDIADIEVPAHLMMRTPFASEAESNQWEDALIALFSSHYELFTPFPKYFRVRGYEHRLLRQLAPEYFGPGCHYGAGLEIGCGYGFKSIILSRMVDSLVGIDIPVKYKGYVRGKFETSVDVARLMGEKFGIGNVRFAAMWPTALELEDASVSFIYSEYVLEHIPELEAAIREMHRVLRPGGLMVHVVPTTIDPLIYFTTSQLTFSPLRLGAALLHTLTRKRRGHRFTWHGLYVPPPHSEHLNKYAEQFTLNALEGFVFPMLETGFRIERMVSTREHNRVIFARKEA